jgi:hypothetical protein
MPVDVLVPTGTRRFNLALLDGPGGMDAPIVSYAAPCPCRADASGAGHYRGLPDDLTQTWLHYYAPAADPHRASRAGRNPI